VCELAGAVFGTPGDVAGQLAGSDLAFFRCQLGLQFRGYASRCGQKRKVDSTGDSFPTGFLRVVAFSRHQARRSV